MYRMWLQFSWCSSSSRQSKAIIDTGTGDYGDNCPIVDFIHVVDLVGFVSLILLVDAVPVNPEIPLIESLCNRNRVLNNPRDSVG